MKTKTYLLFTLIKKSKFIPIGILGNCILGGVIIFIWAQQRIIEYRG